MPDIYSFQIDRAHATLDDRGRMTVVLTYPNNPTLEVKRMPEDLDRGIEVLENLRRDGYSTINPIKPASSGSLYRFKDGKMLVHRRDKGAPTHPLYHSAYAGFAATRDHVYTAEGLLANGLRETSEEVLITKGLIPVSDETILITADKKPWLVTPRDSKPYVMESARRLGLDLPLYEVDVRTVDPTDRLIVVDEGGNRIFEARAFLEILRESQTSLNALQIRELPFSSDEVLPVDAEGMWKGDQWLHFNRESYIIDPAEIAGKLFGVILPNPRVYRTAFIDTTYGRVPLPTLQKIEDYPQPYLGPDKVSVVHPHIWAPEDLLRRAMDASGIEGYAGKWIDWELWVERSKKDGKSLLPDDVLADKPNGEKVVDFKRA